MTNIKIGFPPNSELYNFKVESIIIKSNLQHIFILLFNLSLVPNFNNCHLCHKKLYIFYNSASIIHASFISFPIFILFFVYISLISNQIFQIDITSS